MSNSERYRRIKEAVSAAQVARDHGRETKHGGQGREKTLCPFHDDHDPSLKLFPDGGYKCFACDASGDAISLEEKLGRHTSPSEAASVLEERYGLIRLAGPEGSAQRPRRGSRKAPGEPVYYDYRDERDEILYKVKRTVDKAFYPYVPDGAGGYRTGKGVMTGVRQVLYRLPELLAADPERTVYMCEGEKDAERGAEAGLLTTAHQGGSNRWRPEYAEHLRDRRVRILPDNDPAGRKWALAAYGDLEGVAASVEIVELPVSRDGEDLADYLQGGGTVEELERLPAASAEALREGAARDPARHRPEGPKEERAGGRKPAGKGGGGEKTPPADRIIHYVLAEPHELFLDQFGAPHILWEHGEPVPLTSSFDHHLRRLCYEREGKSASSDAVRQARQTIAAFALGGGDVRELHVRSAFHEGKLYYQLGAGRVVEVDRDGYRAVENPPVLFRTVRNLQPLPDPEAGGTFEVLGKWVNLKDGRDKRMYIAWLATAVLPHVPRPMLEATGVMGSGKTTAGRIAKRALDPGTPETVRPDPREFLQKASHAHIIMLDNQNSLPEWAVDTLCRLVTGEADSKRVLYTDDEDVVYEMKRAVILNGINAPTDRGDARDRTLPVEFERIPDTRYRSEEEMWAEFEQEHPRLLGAVFETLSGALRVKEALRLDRRARLADWSEYAAAVYEVLGWGSEKFTEDWDRVVRLQNQGTLEGSSLAQAIMHFMESRNGWEGLSTDLYAALEVEAEEMSIDVKRDKSWPKSPSWLWRRIKEVKPLLTALGIDARREVERGGTRVLLRRVEDADGHRGSTGEERGSTSEMLPRMLPRSTPGTYGGSGSSDDSRGSSGSIPGYSGDKLSRAIGEEKPNTSRTPGEQTNIALETEVGRKVPGNAATATDAATERVPDPGDETREGEGDKPPNGEPKPRERLQRRVAERRRRGEAVPGETL